MENGKAKRLIAMGLTAVMAMSLVISGTPGKGFAAKKTKLKKTKISVYEGKAETISILGKKAKHKYTFASKNKKIAKVSAKGKITGVKAGKTKIVVKDSYRQKGKKKVKTLGTVAVTVRAKEATPSAAPVSATPPAAAQTQAAMPPVQTQASTPEPTAVPTETPVVIANLWPDEWSDDYEPPVRYNRQESNVEYGEMKEISYYSTTTGKDRKANVLLPAGYTEEKQYPVIYLLHGIAGDHNEWSTNPKRVLGNLIASGEIKEVIAVMPNVRARENDAGGPSDTYSPEHSAAFNNFLNDLRDNLMPYMKENYSIAEGRENTAIAGLSMGGRTALYIGLKMPETFGYIGAFEPAPGVLGEGGLFTDDEFKLPDEYNGKTVILIQKGKKDSVVSDNPLNYHNTFTKNGTKHEYFEVDFPHSMDAWANGLYNFAKRIFQKKD